MQITRLLETILILLNRRKITAKELSTRFNVSVRTIYRDIDALSLSGIPVYSIKGKNGGIFLDEQFDLDRAFIDTKEKEDMFLALKMMKAIGYTDIDDLLIKFDYLFESKEWLALEVIKENKFNPEILENLKRAIILNKEIEFIYHSQYGQTMLEEVQPLKVIFRAHTWLLFGYQKIQEKYKIYPLANIRKLLILNKTFQYNMPSDYEQYFETITITCKFSKRISYKMYDEFSLKTIKVNDDSSYEIDFEFQSIDDIYSFAIPFGKNIEIIKPIWVRDKIYSYVASFLNE